MPFVLGELDEDGKFLTDPNEPPFTADEIGHAMHMRNKYVPVEQRNGRPCQCPHVPRCDSIAKCLEAMAWYFRHQRELHKILGWTE